VPLPPNYPYPAGRRRDPIADALGHRGIYLRRGPHSDLV
jgi:hypothetical protein